MSEMFCFQCQQTAGNSGCVRTGVCGKQPETANLQDVLVCSLIRLADAESYRKRLESAYRAMTGKEIKTILCAIGDGAFAEKI